jgi:broad specificity phosphatase PhoE
MREAQQRALDHLFETANRHNGETIAMVSHCDIIRAMIAGISGKSLDDLLSFDVAPASISRIEIDEQRAQVVSINEPPCLQDLAA